MRMIDADKLIEEIESYRGDIFASEIVELIKQMTSVDDTKWIPCSEKFPDKSGTYIVSAFDGAITRVSFTKWMPRLRTWALSGCRSYWKVTAWMPLPEPYSGFGCQKEEACKFMEAVCEKLAVFEDIQELVSNTYKFTKGSE